MFLFTHENTLSDKIPGWLDQKKNRLSFYNISYVLLPIFIIELMKNNKLNHLYYVTYYKLFMKYLIIGLQHCKTLKMYAKFLLTFNFDSNFFQK